MSTARIAGAGIALHILLPALPTAPVLPPHCWCAPCIRHEAGVSGGRWRVAGGGVGVCGWLGAACARLTCAQKLRGASPRMAAAAPQAFGSLTAPLTASV